MFNIFGKLGAKRKVNNYLSDLSDHCKEYLFQMGDNNLEIYNHPGTTKIKRIRIDYITLENVQNAIKNYIGTDSWHLINHIIDFAKNESSNIFNDISHTFENNEIRIESTDDYSKADCIMLYAYIQDEEFIDKLRYICSLIPNGYAEKRYIIDIFKLFFSDEKFYNELRNPRYKLFKTYVKEWEEAILEDESILTEPCSFLVEEDSETDLDEKLIHITTIDEKVIIYYDNKIYELQGYDFKLVDAMKKQDIVSKINNKFTSFKISAHTLAQ